MLRKNVNDELIQIGQCKAIGPNYGTQVTYASFNIWTDENHMSPWHKAIEILLF